MSSDAFEIETAVSSAKRFVKQFATLAAGVAWALFWLAIVRLHLLQGAYVDATVTFLFTVTPGLFVASRYLPGVSAPSLPWPESA